MKWNAGNANKIEKEKIDANLSKSFMEYET